MNAIDREEAIRIVASYPGPVDKSVVRRLLTQMDEARPERLTDDDFETIRIHLNAYKEKLCNQQRWEEAEEYQRIIDRFMAFASAQPDEYRIPKRPYMSVIPYPYRTDVTVVQCPSCKRRLRTRRTMAKGDKYCPECGQAIDWSGIDG